MKTQIRCSIYADVRRKTKDGFLPIRICVSYERKQNYFGTKYSVKPDEFKEAWKKHNPDPVFEQTRQKLDAELKKADEIIRSLDDFSFEDFRKKWNEYREGIDTTQNKTCLFSSMQQYINYLRKEDRISTAVTYECALSSLKKYTGKQSMKFTDLTEDFLNKYEKWMMEPKPISVDDKGKVKIMKGATPSTIGIYLRPLRHIINIAIKDGNFAPDRYPFGEGKYVIPSSQNIKKALDLTDIEKIYNYEPPHGTAEQKYHCLWLFSYLCNGANIKDIAKLRLSNIDENQITFIRQKTARKNKRNLKPIQVPLTPEIGQIIDKIGQKGLSPNDYVFGILKPGMTAEREYEVIQQTVKMINKTMREISKKLQLTKPVTSYTARHSFATVLKRSGASIEFISESLGHSSLATTENYLSSFELEQKRKYAGALTNFKKAE
jgi:integrase